MNTRLEKARTDISSAKSEVIIGFDQPFFIIGERINPTGRKLLTKEIEALTQHIEKVETAVEPRFQDHFLKAIAIPYDTESSPHLERIVDMPKPAGVMNNGKPDANVSRRQQRKMRLTGA